MELEALGLGPISIDVRLTAVRKPAVEAVDNGLLALVATLLSRNPDDASRIRRSYGGLLVSVPATLPAPPGGFVDVTSFADLARIAAYEERPVLCCGDCFYIVGDATTYRYSSNSSSDATIRSAADRSSVPVTPFGTATQ